MSDGRSSSLSRTNLPGATGRLLVDCVVAGLFVACVCGFFYWSNLTAGTPITYDGDSPSALARINAYAQGEILPLVPLYVSRLNAPFEAAWSDFPSEDLPFFLPSLLVPWFGLANATTLFVILLQVGAAVSFVIANSVLGGGRVVGIGLGILFGLAPYGFQRGLNHINLTAFGTVPLLVMVLIILWQQREIISARVTYGICLAIAVVAGLGNPYYLSWFLGFLLVLLVAQAAQRAWAVVILTATTFAVAIAGFVVQNLDTFIFVLQHGRNPEAVSRNYWGLVQFGLTIPDLVFPSAHQWEWFQERSRLWYLLQVPESMRGESQTAYLGIVALVGILWLGVDSVIRIASNRAGEVSRYFWLVAGLLAFALVGGVNYLLGGFGFVLLRATNRFSIVLAAIALLFLAKKLSLITSTPLRFACVAAVAAIGIWDQLPAWPHWEESRRANGDRDYLSDQKIFTEMENALPDGAMVFQLPVKAYPETHVIHDMGDYEHFRPYLHTRNLRFSYGTIRGRGDADWQADVAGLPASEMVGVLESYGFAAILINRRAYLDGSEGLEKSLRAAGLPVLLNEAGFIGFKLAPSTEPNFPLLATDFVLEFGPGFYEPESSEQEHWVWSKGKSVLHIKPAYRPPSLRDSIPENELTFLIQSASDNTEVLMDNGRGEIVPLLPPLRRSAQAAVRIPSEGKTLHFEASPQPIPTGDELRELSFRILNPMIRHIERVGSE